MAAIVRPFWVVVPFWSAELRESRMLEFLTKKLASLTKECRGRN